MKITAVQAIVLQLPDVTTAADGTQDTCLIRIETDAGITGWGEVDSAPTVVRAAVEAPLSNGITRGWPARWRAPTRWPSTPACSASTT